MATCGAGVTTPGHCCWVPGVGVCPLLRDDGPAAQRRYVCTLAEEHKGNWRRVHRDGRYAAIGAAILAVSGADCGDWPPPGQTCAECGVTGDGVSLAGRD